MMQLVQFIKICLCILLLAGCASNHNPHPEVTNTFEELYQGKSKALYSTMLPPSSAKEAEARADKAITQGEEDKALYLYVQSLGMDEENPDVFYKIAEIYSKRNNDRLSAAAYSYALKYDPNHTASLEGLGLIQFRHKKMKLAKSFFEKSLEGDYAKWRSMNALGIIADLEGEYVLAQDHYHSALEIVPGSTKVLNNLAYSYYLQGDHQKAIELYNRILSFDTNNSLARANIGLVYVREGMYRGAFNAFKYVLDEAQSYNMIGYLIMIEQEHLSSNPDIAKYRVAEDYFKRAIEASSRYNQQAHDNLDRLNQLISKI